jgi:quinol monooxygenase YgiN
MWAKRLPAMAARTSAAWRATPNSFIFVEEWDNLDGLYRHYQTKHFAEFFAALPEVLAGSPEGSVHEVASTLTLTDSLAAAGVA